MPKRKTYSTRGRGPARKRRRRLRSRRRRRYLTSRQNTSAVSPSQVVKFRYVDTITLNPGVGTTAEYNFRANSIHDPDFTGVGHQPLGHDQWANFYEHYTVIGSKLKATFFSPGDSVTTATGLVGVMLDEDTTSITSIRNMMEQAKARTRYMTTKGGPGGRVSVTSHYSPKRFFAIKDMKDNRNLVGSLFGNNPTEGAYFKIFAGPANTADDVGIISVVVEVEYICLLSERRNLLES